MRKLILFLIAGFILTGCHPRSYEFEPEVSFVPLEHHVGNLPHAFTSLDQIERATDWGKEMLIGDRFAREFDFYRAITCYKRAQILMPPIIVERRFELNYNIVQSYYLACKYRDAANSFEGSNLVQAPPNFPALHDLLIMVYDSYYRIGECRKAEQINKVLEKLFPETAQKMHLAHVIEGGRIDEAACLPVSEELHEDTLIFLSEYRRCAKSVKKAQWLNAILPGAGYAYVGQKQSALTSFLLNSLFIAGAYQFFHKGYWAAGGVMTSLEFGWYFGGINGAGLEAKEWNQRLYETTAHNFMQKNRIFPVLMFEKTF